jgi:hypothetical protein
MSLSGYTFHCIILAHLSLFVDIFIIVGGVIVNKIFYHIFLTVREFTVRKMMFVY